MEHEFQAALNNVVSNETLEPYRQSIAVLQEKLGQQEAAIQQLIAAGGGGGGGGAGEGGGQEIGALRSRCQTLELKTGTFEGIVTTLHREIERCITALETSERQRAADKQKIEENLAKIRNLERTLSLKVCSCIDIVTDII